MAYGHYNGKSIKDPEIRQMFTRESLLNSKWYQDRLLKKQSVEVELWKRNIKYLEQYQARPGYDKVVARMGIQKRLDEAKRELERVSKSEYVGSLVGTLGADPIHGGYPEEGLETSGNEKKDGKSLVGTLGADPIHAGYTEA